MSDLQLSTPESSTGNDLGILRSNDNYFIPVTAQDPAPELGPVNYFLTDLADGGDSVSVPIPDSLDGGGATTGTGITTSSFGTSLPSSTWLPSYLHLDSVTGYIYGNVPIQEEYLKKYSIGIGATKTSTTSSITTVNTFTLGILNNDPDIITWENSSTLSIIQGLVSELTVNATHTKSIKNLQYSFVGNTFFGGFTLTNSGHIIGQATTSGVFTATVVAWNPYFPINLLDGGHANQPQDYDAYGGFAGSIFNSSIDGGNTLSTYNSYITDGGSSKLGFTRSLHDTDGGSSVNVYSINDLDTDGGSSSSLYGTNETFVDGGIPSSTYSNYDTNGGSAITVFSDEDLLADSGHAQLTPIFDSSLAGPVYPYPFSTQTITINITPSIPYAGMYVRPFLSIPKRKSYSEFINNPAIFTPELLYRNDDPNFGVQKNIKMILEFGIQSLDLKDYIPSLWENFNRRRLSFGAVKTAKAQDQLGNHLYDVVYVDVVDNISGVKPVLYKNDKIYYPASVENMRTQLSSIILPDYTYISIDQYHLPKFMQTPQAGSYLPTNYITVVPLCYVKPGQSAGIVSQIRLSKFDFKLLDFEIDRLVVQNSLDNTTDKYIIFPRNTITSRIDQDRYIYYDNGIPGDLIADKDNVLITRD
jgi:hypothetical protein